MTQQRSIELTGGRALGPAPFFIAGILNVTPDSFYDGGRHCGLKSASDHAEAMLRDGADIIDVGGESTRPGASPVGLDEELARVVPVVAALGSSPEPGVDRARAFAVSVDTYKSVVAHAALEAGAGMVNDVSAARYDPAMADVLAQHKPGYVLMHSQGRPREMQNNPAYDDVVGEILDFFEERMAFLTARGLPESRILLDPGIGFGKTLQHNVAILTQIRRFQALGRPLYIGLSNKSLWSMLLGVPPEGRQNATQAATALMAAAGVTVHRVHEVGPTRETLAVAAALS